MPRPLATWRIDSRLIAQLVGCGVSGKHRHFRKNEVLYEQGTASGSFYLIVRGLVQVSMIRPDGAEIILEFMGPESVCGEGSAFDGLPRFSSAIAIEDTEAVEFDARSMEPVFQAHPEFAIALLRVTSVKQRVLAVKLEHLASGDPGDRILELFGRLAAMFGVAHPNGRLLSTRITHEQIAAMTGTSRVTVTRTLQRFRAHGTITVKDGHFIVRATPAGAPAHNAPRPVASGRDS